MAELPPAGWYPNPENDREQRYWDGAQWTDHTAPLAGPPPGTGAPPAPGAPPAAAPGAWTAAGGDAGWGAQAPGHDAGWGAAQAPGYGTGWGAAQGPGHVNPPGSPGWQQAQGIDPWLWQSIVATILGMCCYVLPGLVGVPAIVFASQANSARSLGDVATTREKARMARIFTLISAGLTLLAIVGFVVLIAISAASDPNF